MRRWPNLLCALAFLVLGAAAPGWGGEALGSWSPGIHSETANLKSSVGTNPDRQQANTKEEDPTGLLNEGFRYRDLETGTFITRDPLGFVDGPNVYTYVVQNPWTKFDPLGLRGGNPESIRRAREAWDASGGYSGRIIAAGSFVKNSFVENFSQPADLIRGGFNGEFDDLNTQAVVLGTFALVAATVETGLDIATFGADTAPKQALKTAAREGGEAIVEIAAREVVESAAGTAARESVEGVAEVAVREIVEDAGEVAVDAPRALPAPRQIEASWGVNTYRHGGQMSAIEHINYRHAFNSGFENVGRFAEGTSVRQIQ